MKVIPAIDLRNGTCVRLLRGEFDSQTTYSNDPLDIARRYEAAGFQSIHLVDLDGAESGRQKNAVLVRQILRGTTLNAQLGGGIRTEDELQFWLDAGVSRCVIGSLAVTSPDTVIEWSQKYGASQIVVALDVRVDTDGVPRLATHGWKRTSSATLWEILRRYQDAGLAGVLCTDISRDGAMSGPNAALYGEIVERFAELPVQASGGVRNTRDLRGLQDKGIAAAIVGRALLEGEILTSEIQPFLPAA